MRALFSDNDFQCQLKSFIKIQITIYKQINLMYNINIIKVKEKGGKIKKLNHLKIQITIYISLDLMYNIIIIKD